MPEISVHCGLTFHMGPAQSNQYGRLDITFDKIDPAKDVDEQIASGVGAARKAFEACVTELDSMVEETLSGKRAVNKGSGWSR